MTQPVLNRSISAAAGLALLGWSIVAPAAAADAICDEQPIIFGQTPAVVAPTTIDAPVPPLWKVVPPSSDPDAGDRATPTFSSVRGIAVCGSDQLVLVRTGAVDPTVVRLPGGVTAASVPPGTELLAVGLARPDGGVDAVQLTILPDDAEL
jgi:hypothetical protein